MPAPQPSAVPLAVRYLETGTGGVLTPTALLDLFQEAADQNARTLGFDLDTMLAQSRAWVIVRLTAAFDGPLPAAGALVTVETWPAGVEALFARRDARVLGPDGSVLARITTRWVLLDLDRRRPARLPADLAALVLPDRTPVLVPDAARPEGPAAPDAHAAVVVRRTDLDTNGHTNNVRYAEWALEALPDAWHDAHRLTGLDLYLRAETHRGDRLTSEAGPAGDDPLRQAHRLVRDGQEVAAATTTWAPR